MKKLYRKGTVHPSPTPSPSSTICPHFPLSFLPAAILALAAALSADDKEVLAYLLSCSATTPFDFDPTKTHQKKHLHVNKPNIHHAPSSTCYCFSCYTNYWARWDASPSRQLIHEIIDAFEDGLLAQRKKKQGVNKKRKNHINNNNNINNKTGLEYGIISGTHINNIGSKGSSEGSVQVDTELRSVQDHQVGGQGQLGDHDKGPVRKIVSFIGERIWGSVWG